jgi:hypothetical protein
MFVGCVVAGAVVLASGGAKARGALLREAAGYLIAVAAAAAVLASGSATPARAGALLALYAAFVLVVLSADMWRIARERMRCGQPYPACKTLLALGTPLGLPAEAGSHAAGQAW